MEGDYTFNEDSDIDVKLIENGSKGATIVMTYSFGQMPFKIISKFGVEVNK